MFVDGLGCGGGGDVLARDLVELRKSCCVYLSEQVGGDVGGALEITVEEEEERFGIKPFFIDKGVCVRVCVCVHVHVCVCVCLGGMFTHGCML